LSPLAAHVVRPAAWPRSLLFVAVEDIRRGDQIFDPTCQLWRLVTRVEEGGPGRRVRLESGATHTCRLGSHTTVRRTIEEQLTPSPLRWNSCS
jgi:hypothetical protein